jgi:hypothetical protein
MQTHCCQSVTAAVRGLYPRKMTSTVKDLQGRAVSSSNPWNASPERTRAA